MQADWLSTAVLYTDAQSLYGHWLRLLNAEKGQLCRVEIIDDEWWPVHLAAINTRGTLPFLTDKNLSLWSPVAIERFLEERFPHPSFLPVDPISRAAIRQLVIEICEHYSTFDRVEYTLPLLRNLVTALGDSYYLCGDTYTEADIALAPWLYKVMDYLRVPPSVQRYAERLFKRSAFRASLVEVGTGLAKDCA